MGDTTTSASARPIPRRGAYIDSQPFWDGLAQGQLVLQYCTVAQRFQHYPKPVSGFTGRRTLEWRAVAGTGTVYARTVVRIAGPGVEGRLPLCVATVELDEGVRIVANILRCAPQDLAIGQRVRLALDALAPDHPYPAFELF